MPANSIGRPATIEPDGRTRGLTICKVELPAHGSIRNNGHPGPCSQTAGGLDDVLRTGLPDHLHLELTWVVGCAGYQPGWRRVRDSRRGEIELSELVVCRETGHARIRHRIHRHGFGKQQLATQRRSWRQRVR